MRYRDEPAILAWEVGNELRCKSCGGSAVLNDAIRALARHLRESGARQLIADGGEGHDDDPRLYPGLSNTYAVRGDEGASFSKLLGAPELDLVSYHLYTKSIAAGRERDVDIWLDRHQQLAQAAGKPVYLGEFGHITPTDAGRAATFDRWLTRLFTDNSADLALLWQLIPSSRLRPEVNDQYGVVPSTDIDSASALYRWTRALGN